MSKLFARIVGFFSSRTQVGVDKAGNRYFARNETIDGNMKEKRWVIFKGEEDPTSIPVEWICWLNGQRKRAPTPEEMIELEARRERVRQNIESLKKEEEERRAREGSTRRGTISGKVGAPDLQSFLRQIPTASEGVGFEAASEAEGSVGTPRETEKQRATKAQERSRPRSSEPTGSGPSFKPGTWEPPS
ncbi:hypothetical protein Nepgr_007585 [Nepenthes gracilis]|uniref:NADH dehydrogenase [ubiquinone] 1 alpha subcomplex subunit 12 n=1 Tax=Nepenthes gracilis TaxID=150966 RepID=A0AAD3XIK3_NEPGR|nr:hypothetical protein Nepgr_007585 [Nepenthes gracilis]